MWLSPRNDRQVGRNATARPKIPGNVLLSSPTQGVNKKSGTGVNRTGVNRSIFYKIQAPNKQDYNKTCAMLAQIPFGDTINLHRQPAIQLRLLALSSEHLRPRNWNRDHERSIPCFTLECGSLHRKLAFNSFRTCQMVFGLLWITKCPYSMCTT